MNTGSAVTVKNTTVKPVNGTVKFTINSAAPDDVVPVIWLDSTTGKTGLDLNADNTPSEKFAVGGETVYTPQAAPNGSTGTWTVVSNDEAANTFVGSTGATSTQRTFSYDSNDVYTENGHQVTMDAFEKALSTDDQVTPTYYYTDSSLDTTWALNDRAPGAPTGVTVAQTKGSESTSLTVSWTAPSLGSPDTYNVYRLKSDATTSNFPDDYTKVGSVNGDTTKYVDSGLTKSTTCKYVVTAVDQGDESDASTAQTGTTAANNATDQTAPVAQETAVTTSGGLGTVLDAGDVVKIGFDEKVAAPANGDRIRVQDTNSTPTVADLVNGSNATFSLNTAPEQIDGGVARPAGTVLTIALTGDPSVVTAGTNGGVQYPATIIDQAGLTDVAGNVWKPGATGQDVEILAPGQENWAPLNSGTTYNGQTLTLDDTGTTAGTSYENQNLQVPVKAGDEISFEYKLGTNANCTQGSPRVFIRGGAYYTADNTNLGGLCGTQIGTSDWYKVTYTVPSGATAGDAGYTGVVNDNSNGVVQVRNVMIAGQQVL
ncbi:MAG: fibronectin type III domain-containing protein [Nocardioidaceae bacterium]